MTAMPIGGGGARATSQALNVGYGQMIFFTVGVGASSEYSECGRAMVSVP